MISACAQSVESTLTEYARDVPPAVPSNRHSSLGACFLPNGFVEVQQLVQKSDKRLLHSSLTNPETVARADTRRMFCLDYLEFAFPSDQVQIKKTPFWAGDTNAKATGPQLLETIASSAVDQSAIILRCPTNVNASGGLS